MSSIAVASWSDFGYRNCGPLPKTVGSIKGEFVAEFMCNRAGYDAVDDTWIRRRGRAKDTTPTECLRIRDVIDRTAAVDGSRFDFVKDFFRSEWANARFLQAPTFEMLIRMVHEAPKKATRELEVNAILKAITICGSEQLAPLLRDHVLPWFFSRHQDGQVVAIEHDLNCEAAMAGVRSFYTAAQVPFDQIKANKTLSDGAFPTLQNWHGTCPVQLSGPLIEFWNYFFRPAIQGFRVELFGLTFLFITGQPIQYVPPNYPHDWLAVLRAHASFGAEPLNRADFYEALKDPNGAAAMRAAHQPVPHTLSLSPEEQVAFLRWYIRILNAYLFELTDIANFTVENNPKNEIDPIAAFEHYLTIDRLIRRTIAAMAAGDVGSGKSAVFDSADLLDTLSVRFGHTNNDTELFKRLFDTAAAPQLICQRFQRIPGPVGQYLCDFTKKIYAELQATVTESIWMKTKINGTDVLVRNSKLTAENPEPISKFVGNLMRAYRNGHHGYFSSDREPRPSRYLFLVDGTVPDSLVHLPSLWLLTYLMDPSFIGWNHLGVSSYELK